MSGGRGGRKSGGVGNNSNLTPPSNVSKNDIDDLKTYMSKLITESAKKQDEKMKENLSNLIGPMKVEVEKHTEQITDLEKRVQSLEDDLYAANNRIANLTDELNGVQQHQRNGSIRIHGLQVPRGYGGQNFLQYVYENSIKQILAFAEIQGAILTVPESYEKVLEYGHILPQRRQSEDPPSIIVRFISRTYLVAVLKYRFPGLNPTKAKQRGWDIPEDFNVSKEKESLTSQILIYGDLTRRNARLLKELKDSEGVHSAWRTANGKIAYSSAKDKKKVHIVQSLFQKFDLS